MGLRHVLDLMMPLIRDARAKGNQRVLGLGLRARARGASSRKTQESRDLGMG